VTLAGHRATALALIFSELLGNAIEHGGRHVRVSLQAGEDGEATLEVADDGSGIPVDPARGTGLSIVHALVRDELGGTIELDGSAGTRARVRFPT
jgi:two-component sensor histidine kinase